MIDATSIKNSLEKAAIDGNLISCLLSFDRKVRAECGPILTELHNTRKISLFLDENLTAISSLSPIDLWSLLGSFEQAIPDLDCSHQDILILAQTLAEKTASGGIMQSLIKWCKTNPEKAKLIIEQAKLLEPTCLSYCAYAIRGIEAPEIAFELLMLQNQTQITVGLRSLGMFNLNSTPDLATRIIDECCNIIKTDTRPNVRSSAINTALQTWEKFEIPTPYRQQELIDLVINRKIESELIQFSEALSQYQKALVNDSIDQILDALDGIFPHPEKIIENLDRALHYKKNKRSFSITLKVFATQILQLDFLITPNSIYNFCNWALEDANNSSMLFSNWLQSGDSRLCNLLAEIAGESHREKKLIEISKSHLPEEANDQIFIARKSIGFLWFHEVTAASILFSIVKNGHKSARGVAEGLLYNPLLLSYGGELREFLETKVKASSKRVSECATRLMALQDLYLAGLEQTHKLVEFLPTPEQRRAAAIKDRARNNEIQKKAHENSILSDLAKGQTLLYGKKSFYMIYAHDGNQVPSIMPLTEFSYSTEIPRLSVLDSVGFQIMLTEFRMEKKI